MTTSKLIQQYSERKAKLEAAAVTCTEMIRKIYRENRMRLTKEQFEATEELRNDRDVAQGKIMLLAQVIHDLQSLDG